MRWPDVEIRQVAEVASGFGFPRKYQGKTNEEVPFFKVGDMNLHGNERCMTVTTNTISSKTLKKLKAKAFPQGTIIFPKIGAAIATNKKRMLTMLSVVDNNVMGLIPSQHIEKWYLYYWMQQFDLRSVSNIGPVPSTRKTEVEKVLIPLPPISEQRRIVEILEQADRLRKLRADADAKAQRILPALFIKMFGDPAMNPMGWNTVLFNEVVEIGTQLVDPNHPDFLDLPHIGGEHIEKKTGRVLSPPLVKDSNLLSNKFYFSSDHILLSKIRLYLNKVAYPRFYGVCSADIYPLRPIKNNATHWYLVSLLRTQAFLDYAKAHSDRLRIPKLNKAQLGAFEFPLPDPHLMVAFDERVEKIISVENFRFALQEKIETLYQVILYRAFTGDLTASWREAHMKKLLQEMDIQAKALAS